MPQLPIAVTARTTPRCSPSTLSPDTCNNSLVVTLRTKVNVGQKVCWSSWFCCRVKVCVRGREVEKEGGREESYQPRPRPNVRFRPTKKGRHHHLRTVSKLAVSTMRMKRNEGRRMLMESFERLCRAALGRIPTLSQEQNQPVAATRHTWRRMFRAVRHYAGPSCKSMCCEDAVVGVGGRRNSVLMHEGSSRRGEKEVERIRAIQHLDDRLGRGACYIDDAVRHDFFSLCQISLLVSGRETCSSLSARAKPVRALWCLPGKLLCDDDVSSKLACS
jgi:hypothetical protein